MEGDIAKLPDIVELVRKYDAILLVDDSHATGVIGRSGRGTEEYYNMQGEVDIITSTFGKALGGRAAASLQEEGKSLIFACRLPDRICSPTHCRLC